MFTKPVQITTQRRPGFRELFALAAVLLFALAGAVVAERIIHKWELIYAWIREDICGMPPDDTFFQADGTRTEGTRGPMWGDWSMPEWPKGTPVADFTLPRVMTDASLRFSELYRRKPTVLILSSFT